MFDRIIDHRILVFDTETTGTDPQRDAIVELGAVVLEGGQVTQRFSLRLHPGCAIPKGASDVHGITDADVAKAPLFEEIAERIAARFGAFDLFCGYNALGFDLPLVNAEFERAGHPYRVPADRTLDPMVWYKRRHRGRSAKLTAACEHLEVPFGGPAHAAAADAEATAGLLRACIRLAVMPVEVPHALEAQPREAAKLEADFARWGTWLYAEFGYPHELRLGNGKHRGVLLAEAPRDYLRWALTLDDIPPAVRAAFSEVAGA